MKIKNISLIRILAVVLGLIIAFSLLLIDNKTANAENDYTNQINNYFKSWQNIMKITMKWELSMM